MQFYWLVVGVLVVWRITHLLQAEDGPWDIVARLRRRVGDGFWGRLLDCFYCLSLWVALPVSVKLGEGWIHSAFLWPALSAGAILLERATTPQTEPGPPAYYEEKTKGEGENGLLRTE